MFSARHASCSQLGLVFAARYVACSQLVGLYLFPSCVTMLLSPAFSKKSGGTLFLVFRGAWCVVRGAWCVVRSAWCVVRGSEFLVGTLSP